MVKKDVVVIGAGMAGYVCAIRLAQLGRKVTVIEKGELGGVCLNVGCIPSKALIYAGTLYEKMQHASEMGIEIKGAKLDLAKLVSWKEGVVKKLTGGVGGLLKSNGCEVIKGEAVFTGPSSLQVRTGGEKIDLSFDACVVATGSRPSPLKGFEVDQDSVIDSTGALALKKIPETMLCIGGGYIGLELGTFFAKIGTKVTVAEAFPNLLGSVEPECVTVVAKRLAKLGVDVQLGTAAQSPKKVKGGVEVKLGAKTAVFEKVLLTVGRTPNTEGLGLDKAGVKLDAKGFVSVNAARQTTIPAIYAIGDCAGQPLLAHKGSKEGLVAAEAIAGKRTIFDVIAMPAVIFTDPEIATVGLTEKEAREKGFDVQIGRFPFAALGRALAMGEPDGLVKMVSDAKTGRLLGVHIAGVEASNLISEAALALEMGASVEDLSLTVHPHPTLPEALMECAEVTLGHAIHIYQRKAAPRAGVESTAVH